MRYRVCVSIASGGHRRMVELARRAQEEGADMVELRIDYLDRLDQADVTLREVRSLGIETVATLRSSAEGGRFSGGPEEAADVLRRVGPRSDLIDVDSHALGHEQVRQVVAELGRSRVIASAHLGPNGSDPEKLAELAHALREHGDLVKVVTRPSSLVGAIATLSLYHSLPWSKGNLIAFSVGKEYAFTRPLSLVLGAPFAYAALQGMEVAPGQMTVEETRRAAHSLSELLGAWRYSG
ncbi:MAG: type I 3-dehydroquinate dehydratase [Aigarchaeota archaeon]|nr:type I 3-dehydroquinate dehydratase [Candidatus Calditenuis fumarioli]